MKNGDLSFIAIWYDSYPSPNLNLKSIKLIKSDKKFDFTKITASNLNLVTYI